LSLFLVAHELAVLRTPSTKAAQADLTPVLVCPVNLGRSYFDELWVAFFPNAPVGCRQPMGSMRLMVSASDADRNGASVDEGGSVAVGDAGRN
jgi:hypothetical protein